VKTLTELREWNTAHERMGTIKYGQSQLDASDKIDLERDRAKYEEDRARDIRLGGTTGIDAALKAGNVQALLFPGASSAGIASKPGYPTVLVPFGMIPNTPGNLGGGRGGGRGEAPPPAAPGTAPAGATPSGTPAGDAGRGTAVPPFPPGFEPRPQPYGVGFTGTACSEPTLLRLAYAFEQATKKRMPPPGLR
jgi:amidase